VTRPARSYCLVATAYLVRDGKTLLHKHRKLGLWLPPGGHIEAGETPDEAVLREVREETGLAAEFVEPPSAPDIQDDRVESLHQPQRVQVEAIPNHPHHVDLIYFMRAGPGEAVAEAGATGWRWFSPQDLSDPDLTREVRESAAAAIAFVES
jgi:ADP-ribose pyrophosphatase YjhB (NUDIX family)